MSEFLKHLAVTLGVIFVLLFSFLVVITSEAQGLPLSLGLNLPRPTIQPLPVLKVTEDTLVVNPKRLVKMVGIVDARLVQTSIQLFALANENTSPIYIQIDGPGGMNIYMNRILQTLDIIKARGIEVHCFVPSLAASAHFNILALGCTHRYAFKRTELMFHGSRIMPYSVPIGTEAVLGGTLDQLKELNDAMFQELCLLMRDKDQLCLDLRPAFDTDKIWKAPDLAATTRPGFLKILKDIQGVDTNLLMGGIGGGRGD